MLDERPGRPHNGFLKKEPGQESAEEVHQVVIRHLAFRQRGLQTHFEDEVVAEEEYERVDRSPKPSCGGPDIALLEITADELHQQSPALDQVAKKMFAGNWCHETIIASSLGTHPA